MLKKETVAVIDVGSNSIKLLIAQKRSEGSQIEPVFRKTCEARISEGISKENPELTREAIDVGSQAITELVSIARSYDPEVIRIVATSAVRDASNGSEFVARVKAATGIQVDVLSGMEEATYIGQGLCCDPQVSAMNDFVQMDIGGGSLELIRFSHNTIQNACSLQLGAVRLTEKFVPDRILAISEEVETTIRTHVTDSVKASGFSFEPTAKPMIVTGGAFSVIRSILAARTGLTLYNISPVIHRRDISELKSMLCNRSLDERKTILGLPEARADVMPVGLITIDTILELACRDSITHSSYNLRYGIAAELLA